MLKFKYCECGCHGHLAVHEVCGKQFWIYQTLYQNGDVAPDARLYLDHESNVCVGNFQTFKDAQSVATELLKINIKNEIDRLTAILADL